MMRAALIVALLALAAPVHAAEADLYSKVGAKLAADPALAARLGKPGVEMASLAWMIGTWDVVTEVQAGTKPRKPEHGTSTVRPAMNGTWLEMRDFYPSGTQDVGFLTYNPVTRVWVSIALDSTGNAITTTGGFNNLGLMLHGDVTIVGVKTHLRQTILRQGENGYLLRNEERTATGGWRLLDTYRYTRKRN